VAGFIAWTFGSSLAFVNGREESIRICKISNCRSQRPRDLRHEMPSPA
jgi:hypothetical protein